MTWQSMHVRAQHESICGSPVLKPVGLEGTISTGESTRESGQGLPLAHRDFCSATAACWSAAEQEDCRQVAAATWNAVNMQMQGRLVLHRGISHQEKQIIEQCKYMLVQPDWVTTVVVQVKTKGGTALVADGTLAVWVRTQMSGQLWGTCIFHNGGGGFVLPSHPCLTSWGVEACRELTGVATRMGNFLGGQFLSG